MRGLSLVMLCCLGSMANAQADDAFFREQVAPILERHCVRCHSDATPKGELSLAHASVFRKGGAEGPVIKPGKPDESLLIEKISGAKPAMPKTGGSLSSNEVAVIRRWVESGATWPDGIVLKDRKVADETWWSLRPLRQPDPPITRTNGWARTPIDAFVLARLERENLAPSREADRRTIIRRVTFDLTGLPPTPEAVDVFLNDTTPDAYESLVDRLLALPAYGERWGRHWLDLVHYGDTHGYDKDKRRDHAWPYRDYVIEALNRDTPYAQFVQEQIAGDVLFPNEPRAVIATGFIAAGPWDFVGHAELREGTVDKEKTRLIDRDDMVTTTISTFTSLTVHCARCHDHKFDPIPQKDYYRLQAVFAGVDRGDRPCDDREIQARRTETAARAKAVGTRRDMLIKSIVDIKTRSQVEGVFAPKPPSSPTNGFHSGIQATADRATWVQVDLGRPFALDAIRLIPARPTDFADTPGFGFPAIYRVELADEPSFRSPRVIANRTSPNPGNAAVVIAVHDKAAARHVRVTAIKLWPRTNDYIFALGELQAISAGSNVAIGAEVTSLDSIEAGRWSRNYLVDGYDSRGPLEAGKEGEIDARLRSRLESSIGHADAERLLDGLTQTARELTAIAKERAALPPPQRVYAAVSHAPRPITILIRGEVEQPGEPVGPGALSAVPGLAATFDGLSNEEGARRAALARWITDPANPLTWRSIVNRVWHYHFGRGIVDTPSDFGRNGSKPTHPELLDWLATTFRAGGGSLKALHRLIVTSAVYRQSTADRPGAAAIDGDNRLLWRMTRPRLDAEEIRDAVLSVAGTLDNARGGPGFEPFRFKDDHSPIYDHEDPARMLAPGCLRRSIYRFTVRSVPHPFLDCMDSADPNLNVPVRTSTITALQALALWNDPFMLAQADAFARRVSGGQTEAQIDRAVHLAFGRPARTDEITVLAELARKRGMMSVCRLLFNANEFLLVD